MNRKTKIYPGIILLSFLWFGVSAQHSGQFEIGTEVDVEFSTSHPYGVDKESVVFEKEFYKEGAGYVKVFFKDFDLAEPDYVEIFSPETGETLRYTGRGKVVRGGTSVISNFWSSALWNDRVIVRLYSSGGTENYGFDIEKVAYGFTPEEIEKRFSASFKTICGNDDKEGAKCYEGTKMYEKSKAVSRLFINGSKACTGWLLGSEGHLITNHHCIRWQSDADNTEYEFMAEGDSCGADCKGLLSCRGTLEAESGELLKTSAKNDYSLIKLPGNLSEKYGYLSFRSTLPETNERIYIPQHANGKGKEISVYDDFRKGYAKVVIVMENVKYYADTEEGSSGAPVMAYSDNLVVALHHWGGCANNGVRNTYIIDHLGDFMPEDGVKDGNKPSCNDGVQNGDETGVDCGGSCPDSCPNTEKCGDFGISYVDDNTVRVYHKDKGWTGSWNYVCLGDNCYTGEKMQGYYYRDFEAVAGQKYTIGFKVQDDKKGQFLNQRNGVEFTKTKCLFVEGGKPCCNNGIQDGDETGVDCGGSCPKKCKNECAEFGISYIDDNTVRVYHKDKGWSGAWNYICLNENCTSGEVENGYYFKDFKAILGQHYFIEFKVQDNAIGQYLAPKKAVAFNRSKCVFIDGQEREESFTAKELSIFPNPVDDLLFISEDKANIHYSVIDNRGIVVLKGNGNVLDVSGLDPGIYVLRAGIKQIQFIKK